jgi:hypothetical protein
MRNQTYTLTINLPSSRGEGHLPDVLESIHPISCGPYAGHDLLLVMDDLCGRRYVVRATQDGKHLWTSEKMVATKSGKDYPAPTNAAALLVEKLIRDQSNSDCNAVTCNGRYGCD